MSNFGWIGVDFDGTLVTYDKWVSPTHIGTAIAPIVDRVKSWLSEGQEVRIFTARCWPYTVVPPVVEPIMVQVLDAATPKRIVDARLAINAIRRWCLEQFGHELTITCVKDYSMIELWDDRCVRVEKNTGVIL